MAIVNKISYIICHHTGALNDTFESINDWHRKRGFPKSRLGFYGGYHALILKNGEIKRYREDDEIGAHTLGGYNYKSFGCALQGNFNLELPTDKQVESLRKLCYEKMEKYSITLDRVIPHRKATPTTDCYGKNLSDDWIFNVLNKFAEVKQLVDNLRAKRQVCYLIDVDDEGRLYAMTDKGLERVNDALKAFDIVKKNCLGIKHEDIIKLG